MITVCVRRPPGRIAGYLRTVMHGVFPGLWVSGSMGDEAAARLWSSLAQWHAADPDPEWAAAMLITDAAAPGGFRIRAVGAPEPGIEIIDGQCVLVWDGGPR